MTWIDGVSTAVARTGLQRFSPARGPLVLMYHGIGGADGVSVDSLKAQLDLLLERWEVVPLARAVETLGTPESRKLAAVTFDDGYRDFATLALPALRERAVHATVFVPAGLIGHSNVWDREVAPERAIMDAAELRALDPAEAEIGLHGLSHRRLRSVGSQALRAEVFEARDRLAEACGRCPRLFAYPYGQRDDFDRDTEQAVQAAGFAAACSTCFGRGSQEAERYRLRRVGISAGDSTAVCRRKLEGAYDWTAWKELLGARVRGLRARGSEPG